MLGASMESRGYESFLKDTDLTSRSVSEWGSLRSNGCRNIPRVGGVPAALAVIEPSEQLCSVCRQIDLVKELTAWRARLQVLALLYAICLVSRQDAVRLMPYV